MATAPAEGAPARTEASPQAAEEFSALIAMLIPGAAPGDVPQAAAPAMTTERGGSTEKKGSGEPKGETRKDGKSEQPGVFPFPVQAFVPPVEIKPPAAGVAFVAGPEAAPAQVTTEADMPVHEANAEWPPAALAPPGNGPETEQSEAPVLSEPAAAQAAPAAVPAETPAPATAPSVDQLPPPARMPTEEQAAAPEAALETAAPVQTTDAAAPVAAPVAAPAPVTPASPAAQAVEAPGARQATRPAPTVRPATRKDRSGAQVETGPEVAEPATGSKQPAAEAELAFAARLSERAPADPSARPVPSDPRQPAPVTPAAQEPAPAPGPPEAAAETEQPLKETAALNLNGTDAEPGAGNRAAEDEKPAAATPRPAAAAHQGPTAPQAAPAQPARTAEQPASPQRPAAPNPVMRADFEPARTDAAPQPVRELSMVVPRQVSGDTRPDPVEVRVIERAGQVHVAVRSSDPQLNRSLGEGLGELVTNLESRGYATETWRPQTNGAAQNVLAAAADGPVQQSQAGSGGESFQESGRGHHGEAGDDSSRQQRRGQDEARPQWLEMLEGAVRQRHSNPIRSTFA